MLFITAYLIGILLLPIKENIKNLSNHGPLVWAKAVSATITKKDNVETDSAKETAVADPTTMINLAPFPRPKDNDEDDLVVWAKKAVIVDAETGEVLYQDKMLDSHQIASLTKTMTALVLMDIVKDWDEKVSISQHAAMAGGATVHFLTGEKFHAKDLLKAMLMNSDNTAARALAEHFGGSEDKFVELMNNKAKELNLRNTQFADAAGLNADDRSHSCAYDVAMIAREEMKYPMVLEIMQTPSHIQITSCDEFSNVHQIGNTNKLLGQYSGILGAKTGFTYEAGYCLMMMREVPNKGKLIGVVLDAGDISRWTEMQKMLDWAYNRYSWSVFPKDK
jgi:serine-type D-Ala-D-Ala carboxypeptidase (penicillin-binding protein 5/6)